MKKAWVVLLILALSCLTKTSCDSFDITTQAASFANAECESWRINVELNNIINWDVVPSSCEDFVSNYMLEGQYQLDTERMAQEAKSYANNVELEGDGKDAWVFDVDDTLLSHIPYYAENGFGTTAFNSTLWAEWETLAIAPALNATLSLYNQLLDAQWTVFLLTGRDESVRNVTTENLIGAGYTGWAALILRQEDDEGVPAKIYKSSRRLELEEKGYRIRGNMGDQWSDITGYASGERTFKVPNPMYYIA